MNKSRKCRETAAEPHDKEQPDLLRQHPVVLQQTVANPEQQASEDIHAKSSQRQVNKPVMIDFSGFGCVNCRKMEASVWTDPKVKQILENDYVLITLMVDDKTKLPQPINSNVFIRTEISGQASSASAKGTRFGSGGYHRPALSTSNESENRPLHLVRDIGFLAVERIDESRRLQLLLLGKLPRSQTLHLLVDQFLDRIRLVEDHRLRHTLRENLLDALDMNLLLLPELTRHVVVVRRKDVDRRIADRGIGVVDEQMRRHLHPFAQFGALLAVGIQHLPVDLGLEMEFLRIERRQDHVGDIHLDDVAPLLEVEIAVAVFEQVFQQFLLQLLAQTF